MPSASAHSTPSYAFPSQPLLSFARSTAPVVWMLLMLDAMIASATRQCYYPNGLAAADATPCLPNLPDTGEHSPCCRPPGLDSACLAPTAADLCLNQRATDARAVLSTTAASSSAIPLALDDDDDDDDDDGKHQCPPDRSYIVGLSAGVPLGVCLLAALAAIFVLLNRDRKARERIRQMTEAAREERERAAQEHMIPRLYNPSTTKSMRFSHGSTVVTAGPPPHTPQQQQQEYGYQQPYEGYQHPYDGYAQPYGGYDGGGGVIYQEDAAGAAGPRHASMATSAEAGGGGGVKGGSHVSWATSAGRESSSWAYEYDGEPGSRKERFEMTP
ncbi:hypothetical protein SLS56_001921 [Neofusicoccum ribis]|uniref:Uncharacterized protein n=1 Tax=Neofusicoccum ribis TaxID=45134 RepID=A0ABR3T7A4_9PEZI